MSVIKSYRDLIVWQMAMDLMDLAYDIALALPKFETYGLAAQIRRAAVSVPANIAEGHGSFYRGTFMSQLSVAHASLMELETEVIAARRRGYIDAARAEVFLARSAEVGRLLQALRNSLRRRAG